MQPHRPAQGARAGAARQQSPRLSFSSEPSTQPSYRGRTVRMSRMRSITAAITAKGSTSTHLPPTSARAVKSGHALRHELRQVLALARRDGRGRIADNNLPCCPHFLSFATQTSRRFSEAAASCPPQWPARAPSAGSLQGCCLGGDGGGCKEARGQDSPRLGGLGGMQQEGEDQATERRGRGH